MCLGRDSLPRRQVVKPFASRLRTSIYSRTHAYARTHTTHAHQIDNTFPNRFRVGAYLDDRGGAGGGRGGGDWRGGRGGGGAGSAGARVYRGAVDEIRWWEGVRSEDELRESLWERLTGIEVSS